MACCWRVLLACAQDGSGSGCLHVSGTYPHDQWQGSRLEGFVVAQGQPFSAELHQVRCAHPPSLSLRTPPSCPRVEAAVHLITPAQLTRRDKCWTHTCPAHMRAVAQALVALSERAAHQAIQLPTTAPELRTPYQALLTVCTGKAPGSNRASRQPSAAANDPAAASAAAAGTAPSNGAHAAGTASPSTSAGRAPSGGTKAGSGGARPGSAAAVGRAPAGGEGAGGAQRILAAALRPMSAAAAAPKGSKGAASGSGARSGAVAAAAGPDAAASTAMSAPSAGADGDGWTVAGAKGKRGKGGAAQQAPAGGPQGAAGSGAPSLSQAGGGKPGGGDKQQQREEQQDAEEEEEEGGLVSGKGREALMEAVAAQQSAWLPRPKLKSVDGTTRERLIAALLDVKVRCPLLCPI